MTERRKTPLPNWFDSNNTGATAQIAEKDWPVEELPIVFAGLQETDSFAAEGFCDSQRRSLPIELPAGLNESHFEVALVFDIEQASWHRSRGRSVNTRRRNLTESLMRSTIVVVGAKAVKEPLLIRERRGRRRRGLLFECSVHALVSSILLRLARLDTLRHDTEANPPDAELR